MFPRINDKITCSVCGPNITTEGVVASCIRWTRPYLLCYEMQISRPFIFSSLAQIFTGELSSSCNCLFRITLLRVTIIKIMLFISNNIVTGNNYKDNARGFVFSYCKLRSSTSLIFSLCCNISISV